MTDCDFVLPGRSTMKLWLKIKLIGPYTDKTVTMTTMFGWCGKDYKYVINYTKAIIKTGEYQLLFSITCIFQKRKKLPWINDHITLNELKM